MTVGKAIRRAVVSRSLGKTAVNVTRHVINRVRGIIYPQILPSQQLTKIKYKGKCFMFLHRRTESDRGVLKQCFDSDQYDMPDGAHGEMLERLHRRILTAGKQPLIVDCGANIGASVVWFANRYPEAHIVAVEPAPDNFILLQKNTVGLDVRTVEAGISSQDHLGHLSHLDEGGWAYRTAEFGEGPEIRMISLQTLLAAVPARCQPFILKVDIEGAEKSLFAGDLATLDTFPLVIFEPHDWLLPGQSTSHEFFRFHVAKGREIAMKDENLASVAWDDTLMRDV